jgi:Uncharacterized protein conserved in bacteria (DUF2188)
MAQGDIHTSWDGEKWVNKVEGGKRASNSGPRKKDVQAVGRGMAIDRGVEHVIHDKDTNQIQERNTYPRSRDPRRSKG